MENAMRFKTGVKEAIKKTTRKAVKKVKKVVSSSRNSRKKSTLRSIRLEGFRKKKIEALKEFEGVIKEFVTALSDNTDDQLSLDDHINNFLLDNQELTETNCENITYLGQLKKKNQNRHLYFILVDGAIKLIIYREEKATDLQPDPDSQSATTLPFHRNINHGINGYIYYESKSSLPNTNEIILTDVFGEEFQFTGDTSKFNKFNELLDKALEHSKEVSKVGISTIDSEEEKALNKYNEFKERVKDSAFKSNDLISIIEGVRNANPELIESEPVNIGKMPASESKTTDETDNEDEEPELELGKIYGNNTDDTNNTFQYVNVKSSEKRGGSETTLEQSEMNIPVKDNEKKYWSDLLASSNSANVKDVMMYLFYFKGWWGLDRKTRLTSIWQETSDDLCSLPFIDMMDEGKFSLSDDNIYATTRIVRSEHKQLLKNLLDKKIREILKSGRKAETAITDDEVTNKFVDLIYSRKIQDYADELYINLLNEVISQSEEEISQSEEVISQSENESDQTGGATDAYNDERVTFDKVAKLKQQNKITLDELNEIALNDNALKVLGNNTTSAEFNTNICITIEGEGTIGSLSSEIAGLNTLLVTGGATLALGPIGIIVMPIGLILTYVGSYLKRYIGIYGRSAAEIRNILEKSLTIFQMFKNIIFKNTFDDIDMKNLLIKTLEAFMGIITKSREFYEKYVNLSVGDVLTSNDSRARVFKGQEIDTIESIKDDIKFLYSKLMDYINLIYNCIAVKERGEILQKLEAKDPGASAEISDMKGGSEPPNVGDKTEKQNTQGGRSHKMSSLFYKKKTKKRKNPPHNRKKNKKK